MCFVWLSVLHVSSVLPVPNVPYVLHVSPVLYVVHVLYVAHVSSTSEKMQSDYDKIKDSHRLIVDSLCAKLQALE